MRRRDFITLVCGGAAAWPDTVRAQRLPLPVIGYLGTGSRETDASRVTAFLAGLREAGYVDGSNVVIEYRWAEGENARMPALVGDLVSRRVSVIVDLGGTPGAQAAKAATSTIPIVFFLGIDPVASGFVASLNRPGNNFTGVTGFNVALVQKKLQLLHEAIPAPTAMALLVNPTNPKLAEAQTRDALDAARILGRQLHVLHASSDHDFDTAFATLDQLKPAALVVGGDGFFVSRSERLAALTIRHAVPAIYEFRPFVAAGGLMSYGTDLVEVHRLVGVYTGRILHGGQPSDLPVLQATRVELIINMKAAKSLGLSFPLSLLGRADEVIE